MSYNLTYATQSGQNGLSVLKNYLIKGSFKMNKSVAKVLNVSFNPIQSFEKYLSNKGKSEKTIVAYIKDLELFEKYLNKSDGSLLQLTRIDVQSYMNYLEVELNRSASTIDRQFNSIRQFAISTQQEFVCRDINKKKKQSVSQLSPKTLSNNDLKGLLRQVEKTENARSQAIIYLLAHTGVRIQEATDLNIGDLIFGEDGIITVTGKGNKEREVPFPEDAQLYINRYLDTREDGKDKTAPLFVSNYNKRMDKRSLQRVVEKVGKLFNALKADNKKIEVHSHIFRHTFCRILVKEQGVDIVTAAQIMGHESIETTRRYAMDSIQDVTKKLNKLTFS